MDLDGDPTYGWPQNTCLFRYHKQINGLQDSNNKTNFDDSIIIKTPRLIIETNHRNIDLNNSEHTVFAQHGCMIHLHMAVGQNITKT